MDHNTPCLGSAETSSIATSLVGTLLGLVREFEELFDQRRQYERVGSLVFGTIFAFARKTLSQVRAALGWVHEDWTADYRLFSQGRFPVAAASEKLFVLTLAHVPEDGPYTVVVDVTHVPRSSRKMPGTAWGRAPGTAPWNRGLARMQRFLNLCWLTPVQEGYRRALPLQWRHAPTPTAVASGDAPAKEWEAGLTSLRWVRARLDVEGRFAQVLLAAGDGSYDVNELWKGLPDRTGVIVRCAKNRKLFALPLKPDEAQRQKEAESQKKKGGAPRKYGERLPTPQEMRKEKTAWLKTELPVRGRTIVIKYRVVGPVLVEGAPEQPLFLILVKGYHCRKVGKRAFREPCQYLVNAVCVEGEWKLPLPLEQLVEVTWHRWEIEVCHREIKSGFGLGQMQCWTKRGAILSVQFMAWAYALIMLAGYRTWQGVVGGPPKPYAWWKGSRRWSVNTLLQCYRQELWNLGDFQPVWLRSTPKGQNSPDWMVGLTNAVAAASRG